jgi:hypothetical protein
MIQGGQGSGSAFIAKRYQDIVRSTSGVGATLPMALHSRSSPANPNFASLATAIPVPAVRADEAIAFNDYLARSKAGQIPFPQPPQANTSSSSSLSSSSTFLNNPSNLGAVVPDQGLLQPSPVPEAGATPGRVVAAASSVTPLPGSSSSSSSTTSASTTAAVVPPSPKWQSGAQPSSASSSASGIDPSLMSSIPTVAPPSAGGDALTAIAPDNNNNNATGGVGSSGGDVSPDMQ